MGTLRKPKSNKQEYVTESLDESRWPSILQTIIEVLRLKSVQEVRVEFGFLLGHDLKGVPQPSNSVVPLDLLPAFIAKGLENGTIEWTGNSDFVFAAQNVDLTFMLCNDADLHFASSSSELLTSVSEALISTGVKVYLDGRLLLPGPNN